MELIYSALLLHTAKQPINEDNVNKILNAAGIAPNSIKIKAMIAALENVNIDEAISKASMPVAAVAPVAEAKEEKKEEKKEEDAEKRAEQAVEGLAGLFG